MTTDPGRSARQIIDEMGGPASAPAGGRTDYDLRKLAHDGTPLRVTMGGESVEMYVAQVRGEDDGTYRVMLVRADEMVLTPRKLRDAAREICADLDGTVGKSLPEVVSYLQDRGRDMSPVEVNGYQLARLLEAVEQTGLTGWWTQ